MPPQTDAPVHSVQFYDGPATLAHRLADFIAQGLARGEATIIIATAEHRMATEGRLVAQAVDLGAAAADGRYLPFDAAEMLERLMVGGRPDRARFDDVIGTVIQRAARVHPRLRAFGEMVGLLWSDGDQESAIALEELWTELLGHHPFTLMCGYPARHFSVGGPGLARVVGAHTDVARLMVAAPA